jgi:hypothetical protein
MDEDPTRITFLSYLTRTDYKYFVEAFSFLNEILITFDRILLRNHGYVSILYS